MRTRIVIILGILLLGLSMAVSTLAQDAARKPEWPQFRGPGRDGKSLETGLLKEWPQGGPKQLWSIDFLGEGFSSISVKDGCIYTMGTEDDAEAVFALDFKTGRKIWSSPSNDRIYKERRGNGPRSTPTLDGDYVYTEGSFGNITCFKSATGEKVWRTNLKSDLGGRVPHWAYSESPLVLGDLLIVTPGGRKGAVAALDKKTGKAKWQSKEVTYSAGYSSPMLLELKGKKQIVNLVAGPNPRREKSGVMISVDASSGKLLWEFDLGVATIPCCSPVLYKDVVIASSGYKAGTAAADVSSGKAETKWHGEKKGSTHGGMIQVGEYLYGFINAMTCIHIPTGKIKWSTRSIGQSSMVYADGHFYCLDIGGRGGSKVVLVETTPEGYREKGRFRIPSSGRMSWVHPVVVGGRLFIRNQNTLTCWDVSAK